MERASRTGTDDRHGGRRWLCGPPQDLHAADSSRSTPDRVGQWRVEFEGAYEPPRGAVGRAFDAIVGHRIAQATVHRFVNDVIEEIRQELPERA
jgi:hypothetical protein